MKKKHLYGIMIFCLVAISGIFLSTNISARIISEGPIQPNPVVGGQEYVVIYSSDETDEIVLEENTCTTGVTITQLEKNKIEVRQKFDVKVQDSCSITLNDGPNTPLPNKGTSHMYIKKGPHTIVDVADLELTKDSNTKIAPRSKNLRGEIIEQNQPDMPTYEYVVEDPTIASIDALGNITALQSGTTNITILSKENSSYLAATKTIKLTVNESQTADNNTDNSIEPPKSSIQNKPLSSPNTGDRTETGYLIVTMLVASGFIYTISRKHTKEELTR